MKLNPDGKTGTIVRGRIDENAYIVLFFQHRHTIETERTGEDDVGPYALIRASRTELPHGWVLEVQPQSPRSGRIGCEIVLRRLLTNEHLRNPERVAVRTSYEWLWTVSFDAAGVANDHEAVGPRPTKLDR